LTIGNPGLGDQIILNALAKGLVSSEFRIEGKLHRQLDINIHPGNSGGPCLDQSGSVVGVVTYKAVGQNGIAFCVPASALQQELARAQKLTARQRAEQASQHLRQTVVTRYATATGCLLKACGLQLGMLVVGVKTELVDASHTLIANADLQRQGLELGLPAVMADKLLPEETKLALIRLAVLHNRAFFAANSPSGTIDEYAAECNSMAEEFAEVVAQLAHQDRPQLARTREEAAR
jgi:hypothetical protein